MNVDMKYGCPKCSYAEGHASVPQETTVPDAQETVVVIDEGQELRTTSTVRTSCPTCQHNLAYIWQVQTRSGDEGATQFFRCTECGHTWRLYT